jgi:Phytochelatin synthase
MRAQTSIRLPRIVRAILALSSVVLLLTQDPAIVERAWALPTASTFGHTLAWQSNASLCGPASLASVFRSLGDTAQTEADVLAHAARCSTGFCIGGYLESEDLVFVLDVNQQYRPWLVERVRLFSAMNTFDGNAKRGLLLIE